MNIGTVAVVGIFCAALAGCVETSSSGKSSSSLSGMTGRLTGGLVGDRSRSQGASESVSAGAAALYSAWAIDDLGRQLDDGDRRMAAEADFVALETGGAGVAREWHNSATGRHGQVTPGAAYAVNQYTCRDFVDAVVVDGRKETRRSTACRQPDGSWRPIS